MTTPTHEAGEALCCFTCRAELRIVCPAGCPDEKALPAVVGSGIGGPMTVAEAKAQLKAVIAREKQDRVEARIEARRTAIADRREARDRVAREKRAGRQRELAAKREAKRAAVESRKAERQRARDAKKDAVRLAREAKERARQQRRDAKAMRKVAKAVRVQADKDPRRVASGRKSGLVQGLREHRCVCGYLTRGNVAWALHRKKCEIFEEVAA